MIKDFRKLFKHLRKCYKIEKVARTFEKVLEHSENVKTYRKLSEHFRSC